MAIEKLIEKDYYPPTKVVGWVSRKIRVLFGIENLTAAYKIRVLVNFFLFGFLAFGVPTIVGILTSDFLLNNIEIVIAFLWLSIGGVLIDFFEYAVDDFWINYRKISNLNKKEFEKIKNKYNKKIFSKKYLILSVITYFVFFNILFDVLYDHCLVVIIMVDLLLIPAAIMWGIIAYLTFYMYYFVRKMCSFPIDLNPFSPDSFGGLSIIGVLPLRVAALISSGSLYIPYGINQIFNLGIETLVGLIISIGVFIVSVVIIMTFFIPLFPVNKLAKNIKNQMLESFGNQLKDRIEHPSIDADENSYLKTLVAIEHYKETKKMRVWPFSPRMILELFGYILLPALLALVGWYLQTI